MLEVLIKLDPKTIIAIKCPGKGIVKFIGKSIPRVIRVLSIEKDSYYMCRISDPCELVTLGTDFNGILTWYGMFKLFRIGDTNKITDTMIERFIRAFFSLKAAELDSEYREWTDGISALDDLIQEQIQIIELQKELDQMVQEREESLV